VNYDLAAKRQGVETGRLFSARVGGKKKSAAKVGWFSNTSQSMPLRARQAFFLNKLRSLAH
jgi:hypothetical protein